MSRKYKFHNPTAPYFVSFATVYWIDIFTREVYLKVLVDSIDYCRKYKGMELYAYCFMPSHVHFIFRDANENPTGLLQDFKKYTSKQIIKTINEFPESRREWMLAYFKKACAHLKREQEYKVWQNGYHAEVAYSNKFMKEKINYIHANPVTDKIVVNPEDYYFSSARNYAELDSELNVIVSHFF